MNTKTILIGLEHMGIHDIQEILSNTKVVSEVYHPETTFSLEDQIVFIYRPLEQWVDASIKSEVVNIKVNNGVFKRLKLLRQFDRTMRNKQLELLEIWKSFMLNTMNLHKKNSNNSCVLHFHSLKTDLECWLESEIDLDSSKYEAELDLINKYSDKEIQEIHNYFTKNAISIS